MLLTPHALPHLVIYDLDGTLVDSAPSIAKALNWATESLLGKTFEEQLVHLWIGNGSLKLVERAAAHCHASPSLVPQLHNAFLEFYAANPSAGTKLFAGTYTLLDAFKKQGIPQAIATNKPQQFVPQILSDLGIAHFFSAITGGNSYPHRKPHPEPLLQLCKRFSCTPSNALMLGDSRADIQAAQAAGMPCWLLEQGYAQGFDLRKAGADEVFKNTSELLAQKLEIIAQKKSY